MMRRISSLNQQHCYNCWKIISNQQAFKHQFPTVNQTTDVISIQNHALCKPCLNLFKNIKDYAQKYKLSYANHKFKLQEMIDKNIIKLSDINQCDNQKVKLNQQYKKHRQSQQLKIKSPQKIQFCQQKSQSSNKEQIYSIILQQTVIQNRFNYAFWLPKSLQYLIYLTSKKIPVQQRHERIKKLIFLVCKLYSFQIKNVKNLVIFLQVLICHMDQNSLLSIIERILKVYIKNNIPFQLLIHSYKKENQLKAHKSESNKIEAEQNFDKKAQQEKWKKFRPDLLLYFSLSVIILSDYIKQKKLLTDIEEMHEILLKSLQLNVSQKSIHSQVQNYVKQRAKNNQKSSKISDEGWQQLLQLKKYQNNYFLILQTVRNEQQANLEYISDIQLKFKKQKEEYINKIIRLNNKIQELSIQLEKYKEKEQSQFQNKVKQAQECKGFNQKTNKSNPEVNHPIKQQIPLPLINRINHSISTSNLQLQAQIQEKSFTTKSMAAQTYEQEKTINLINNLQSILTITDIIQINKKYEKGKGLISSSTLQLPTNPEDLSSLIISQIVKMEKNLIKLKNQGKKNKYQTNRIMSILKRKQQQWLPLFHQKDDLISKYEDALLKLQNGQVTEVQPLATRIKYIASKWNTCKTCSSSVRTQLQKKSNEDIRNSHLQDRNSILQGNSQKQKKKKDKDCIIY